MKLIAAVDKNWGIGKKGKLLVSIPEDMKYFRDTTKDHIVVMGRKTLESFPNGKPLSDRINIVLTANLAYQVKGATVVHTLDGLEQELTKYDTDEIFILGGEKIYRQLYQKCDTAYITKIDYAYEADAYFPNLDKDDEWEFIGESDEQTYFNLTYTFCTYQHR